MLLDVYDKVGKPLELRGLTSVCISVGRLDGEHQHQGYEIKIVGHYEGRMCFAQMIVFDSLIASYLGTLESFEDGVFEELNAKFDVILRDEDGP